MVAVAVGAEDGGMRFPSDDRAAPDALTIAGLALAVLVLLSAPPTVVTASLIGGAFVGIMTFLGLRTSGSTGAIGTWTGRAAAGMVLTSLAMLSLASWLGPGSVAVLALAAGAVMVLLGHLILRRPCP
jgi:hypothetical protein